MLISIQFLRAYASLIVVLHHITYKDKIYGNDVLSFFTFGEIGVDIFFIISGYIMMYSTHRKPVKAKDFIINRVIRIIPLYWVLTICALIIFMVLPDKVNSSGGTTVIFESFFLLPTEGKYLIQNGWTLRYEFLFYFIFMFSLFLNNKKYILIIITTLVLLGLFIESENIYFNFITKDLILEFVFGIFLYFLFYKYGKDKDNLKLSIFFIVISFILLYFLLQNENTMRYRSIYYGIPAFLFTYGIILIENFFTKYKKYILPLGNSSYSLYLVHPFILVANIIILKNFYSEKIFFDIILIFSMLIFSIIAGLLVYYYIELNLISFFKKFKMKKKV